MEKSKWMLMAPWQNNYRKLNFHVKEASTWSVVDGLLSGSRPGNLKLGRVTASFAICIPNLTVCVSRQARTSLLCSVIIAVTVILLAHMNGSKIHGFWAWKLVKYLLLHVTVLRFCAQIFFAGPDGKKNSLFVKCYVIYSTARLKLCL